MDIGWINSVNGTISKQVKVSLSSNFLIEWVLNSLTSIHNSALLPGSSQLSRHDFKSQLSFREHATKAGEEPGNGTTLHAKDLGSH